MVLTAIYHDFSVSLIPIVTRFAKTALLKPWHFNKRSQMASIEMEKGSAEVKTKHPQTKIE